MSSGISEELKNFVFRKIDSIEQIEVLLLLRQHAQRGWTAGEISAELRSAPESVAKRLFDLSIQKLVDEVDSSEHKYQYRPHTIELKQLVDELAETYRIRKFTVINMIFSKKTDALKDFADAFKIKKGGTDDHS